ncbi:MAG TPA: beta-N-acetylhexosaminidase [Tepidisphaeraceae bacterium]
MFILIAMGMLAVVSCRTEPQPTVASRFELLGVVPQPERIIVLGKNFSLDKHTQILINQEEDERQVEAAFAGQARLSTGLPLPITKSGEKDEADTKDAIVLTNAGADSRLGPEGYELEAGRNKIVIRARHSAGLFYGLITLRQLLPPEIESQHSVSKINWVIPGVRIWDQPRFAYRGLMLDSSRHLQSEQFILRTLDLMAYHKLNRFHWHLTDDQGWRLQIPSRPRLTDVSAWRMENGRRYGGFFSQEQVRRIVKYAAERQITIVPEIDMPGHSGAALAAYPELACFPREFSVTLPCIGCPDTLCPAKDATYAFVSDVLDEVTKLFPSTVIHIGGDECNKTKWRISPECQALIRKEHLRDVNALQGWFTGRVAAMLTAHGRRIMGWNEILRTGHLPKDAIVQVWNDERAVLDAARAGNDVIVSLGSWAYFDHGWDVASKKSLFDDLKKRGIDSHGWGYGITTVHKVYEADPAPASITPDESQHILGAEAEMWTELRPDEISTDRYIWPRLVAFSEVCWSQPSQKNWENFQDRLEQTHLKRLSLRGLGAGPRPADELVQEMEAELKAIQPSATTH